MSTDVKPATSRQIAYIGRLYGELGEEIPEVKAELSNFEASKLIGELISKTQRNGPVAINEPRLGMAMKECFKLWHDRDVLGKNREAFIKETILTYRLFTEIVERLAQDNDR